VKKERFPAAVMLALLAGCSGGNSNAPAALTPAATVPVSASGPTTTGTLVIVINRGTATSSSSTRRAQFVSPSSSSVGITVNGGTPSYASVALGSSLCTTSGTTQTCSVPFGAPAGSDTIGLSFYDGVNGAGNLLGTGTVTLGAPFSLTIPISPVVATVSNPVVTYPSGTSFAPGTAGTATLAFTLKDPDGNTIASASTPSFASALTLSSSDPNIAVAPTSWTGPSQAITLTYNGSTAVASSVTITATSGSTKLGTASVAAAFPFSGTYTGTWTNPTFGNSGPLTFILTQSGSAVTGSGLYNNSSGGVQLASGLSGTLSGQTVTLTETSNGTFVGNDTLTLSGTAPTQKLNGPSVQGGVTYTLSLTQTSTSTVPQSASCQPNGTSVMTFFAVGQQCTFFQGPTTAGDTTAAYVAANTSVATVSPASVVECPSSPCNSPGSLVTVTAAGFGNTTINVTRNNGGASYTIAISVQ